MVIDEGSLQEVERYYQSSEKTLLTNPINLHGIGEYGKTQLASNCCRQAQVASRFQAILWVDASARIFTSVTDDFLPDGSYKTSTDSSVQLLLNIMNTWTHSWLLVFDNTEGPIAFSNKSGEKGHVLFISRQAASQTLGHNVHLL